MVLNGVDALRSRFATLSTALDRFVFKVVLRTLNLSSNCRFCGPLDIGELVEFGQFIPVATWAAFAAPCRTITVAASPHGILIAFALWLDVTFILFNWVREAALAVSVLSSHPSPCTVFSSFQLHEIELKLRVTAVSSLPTTSIRRWVGRIAATKYAFMIACCRASMEWVEAIWMRWLNCWWHLVFRSIQFREHNRPLLVIHVLHFMKACW